MHPSPSRAVTLAIILSAAGCTAPAGRPDPAVQRSEEDGVELVMSRRPSWEEGGGWRLESAPALAIGEDSDEFEYVFSAIAGPVRLPDGHIVAGDVASNQVRFFTASGEFERAVGGPGQGPGEFDYLVRLYQCVPNRVLAMDLGTDQASVIDPSGEFLGRIPYTLNAGFNIYGSIACNASGRVLAMDWGAELGAGGVREGHYRTTVRIRLLDEEFRVLHDFGEFPGVDRLGSPGGSSPHPFGKTPGLALGEDRAYIGTADRFEIEVYSLDGGLVRRIRRRYELEPIAGGHVERHIQAETAGEDPQRAEELAIRIRNMPMPETFPAYGSFLLDSEDNLWVENYRVPGWQRRYWSVFDAEGVWLGDVEVPRTFKATEIGTDWMLGIFRDELDEQSIRLYRLQR